MWVIEKRESASQKWRPIQHETLVEACKTKREAQKELKEWRDFVPENQYRVVKYTPEEK